MKKISYLLLFLISISFVYAAAPAVEWETIIGGGGWDEAYALVLTPDNGTIVAGETGSFGAGSIDFWIVKIDSNGNVEWNKTFGGIDQDRARDIIKTSDNNYVVAGYTQSLATYYDCWIIKIDPNGNPLWNKTFGGLSMDYCDGVYQTSDNGYILAGLTYSQGSGLSDFWLIKTDSNGNYQWNKSFGGNGYDEALAVQQTSDNGYIMVGRTYILGGARDAWVVKTDSNGNHQWNKTIGGTKSDEAYDVLRTSDNGYIMSGSTASKGAGGWDYWLVKLDSNGNLEWDNTFGSGTLDLGYGLEKTSDNGYVMVGEGSLQDSWIVKTYSNGTLEWDISLGASFIDNSRDIKETSDNGYIAVGMYGQGGFDFDYYIVKLKQCVDNDGDGFNSTGDICGLADCNDTNASINPLGTESCNNVDEDCDGIIDNGFDNETCQYVCQNNGYTWTNKGDSFNCCGNDVNEADPYEIVEGSCSDGNDNDCNGYFDSYDQDCPGYGSLQLTEGWNLVGYWGNTMNVSNALNSISGCYSSVYNFWDIWKSFLPIKEDNSLKNMTFGYGYWIKVNCSSANLTI